MEKRDALKVWTILLAILTFSLSLLGTFLVRSGVLTSVHSFASRLQTRGIFILGILVLFIGGSLVALRLARADAQAGRPVRAGLPRGRARPQQPLPRHRLRHRVHRHALSAGARGADGREDLRRRAVLQLHLPAADRAACCCCCRSDRCSPGSAATSSALRNASTRRSGSRLLATLAMLGVPARRARGGAARHRSRDLSRSRLPQRDRHPLLVQRHAAVGRVA